MTSRLTFLLVVFILNQPLHAEPAWPEQLDFDLNYRNSAGVGDQRWDIRLGAGFEREPTYQGSDRSSTEVQPLLIAGYKFDWGNLFFSGGGLGFSRRFGNNFGLQLQLESEDTREIDDDQRLAGLGDQDEELELEVNGRYFLGPYTVDAAVAIATGDKGVVWFVGGSRTWRTSSERLFLTLRTDLSGSSQENQQTDFGITDSQSLASGFPVYTAGGGLKSLGLGLSAEYQLSDRWFLVATADFERLLGDVADSPIVFDDNNIEAGISFLYRF
ncbi:MAG: MipA/OmpV family protein [Pseudomonadota bacterium]